MATKKDLIEAQGFSRRRLLTAFTSGAPGGKELEPAKPLRAVVAGVALAVMVLVGGAFYGQLHPGLGPGWENNNVIIAKDTGARYLAIDGVLYPLINATSARLILPAGKYNVISTSSKSLADKPLGPPIGILGAPDDVPPVSALVADGWTACTAADGGVALSVPGDATPGPLSSAALVTSDGRTYVVTAGTAYLVDELKTDSVLRAVGLTGVKPIEVDSKWLNLFAAGAPLSPIVVDRADEPVPGTGLSVGMAVHQQESDNHFIVTTDGELAKVSPLALQLYLLGTGATRPEREVTPAEIGSLSTAFQEAGGIDWPSDILTSLLPGEAVCAVLGHDSLGGPPTTTLATSATPPLLKGVTVGVGAGALVAAGGEGADGILELYVVDHSGTSFAIPDSSDDVLARLGYARSDASKVTTAWMQFFGSGPALTYDAATSTPGGAPGAPASSATPSAEPEATEVPPTANGASVDAASPGQCEAGTESKSAERPLPFGLLQAEGVAGVATGKGVIVAVVDSGIDISNPHLKHAVIDGVNLVADGERADGMSDVFGHGTAIAGLIAAGKITDSELVGLAPDAQLLAVRVLRGSDKESTEAGFGANVELEAQGIRWAVDHDASIINVSISSDEDVAVLRSAIDYATANGALVVASVGNRNTATNKSDSLRYPAAYEGVLGVAAATLQADVTDSSIHGTHVDVAAPGQFVLTTMAGGADCVFASDAPSTSYATGYASAAAALVAQAHPNETPAQWSYRLMATAIRFDPGARDDFAGWGVIQPLDAITLVPGSGERGPKSPFTSTMPVVLHTPTTTVTPHSTTSPFVSTKEAVVGSGIAATVALAAFGIVTGYRRRPRLEPATPAGPVRTGLLDAAKTDRTRLQ